MFINIVGLRQLFIECYAEHAYIYNQCRKKAASGEIDGACGVIIKFDQGSLGDMKKHAGHRYSASTMKYFTDGHFNVTDKYRRIICRSGGNVVKKPRRPILSIDHQTMTCKASRQAIVPVEAMQFHQSGWSSYQSEFSVMAKRRNGDAMPREIRFREYSM